MAEIGTDISKAAAILERGGLVAIPTETVYGLAANGLDPMAVAKIFEAKNRPSFDPLILHINGISEVTKYASDFPENAQNICSNLWPGPLTVVLPKTALVPEIVTAGNATVGLRVPRKTLTLELLQLLPFPLAAPSANPFGYISPTNAQHVQDQLGNRLDYILDGGPCEVGLESTIIRFHNGNAELLRLGGTSPEVLEKYLGVLKERLTQNSNPTAPGQLDKHYAPRTKFTLMEGNSLPEIDAGSRVALLRFQQLFPDFPEADQFILSQKGDSLEAASILFETMRKLDTLSYDQIIAETAPEQGLGRAINDRLRRASVK